jgi:hypothetical protein
VKSLRGLIPMLFEAADTGVGSKDKLIMAAVKATSTLLKRFIFSPVFVIFYT